MPPTEGPRAHRVMSGLVVLAGLYVVVFAARSPVIRIVGAVLIVVGLVGLAAGFLISRRIKR